MSEVGTVDWESARAERAEARAERAEARVAALEERNRKLEEALKPFVNALERLEASCSSEALYLIEDHYEIADGIIWGDLRSARAALSSRE